MKAIREVAGVFAAFLIAAVIMTLPLWQHPTRTLPSDLVDTVLNAWIIGWDADRLRHLWAGVWDAPIYFPYHNALAFSENLLGLAFFVAPVYWISGNAVLTYNVAFVFSFAVAGVGMYVLAYELTRSRAAALVGATFYAFCPMRMAQISHIQMVATGWMPVGLYALHRYFATRRHVWLALFGAAYTLQVTSNMYMAYFMAVPAAVVILDGLRTAGPARWRALAALAIAGTVLAGILAAVALPYHRVRADYRQIRNSIEIDVGSADLRSYLVGKNTIGVWRWLPTAVSTDPEKELLPGVFVIVLGAVAIVRAARSHNDMGRWTKVYLLIAVAAAILSFGPVVKVWGHTVMQHGPYDWLLRTVPGWDGMRVPARFAIVVFLALSVLAAIGARIVIDSFRVDRRIVTAVCCVLLITEGWTVPIPIVGFSRQGRPQDRAVAQWLATRPPGAVLHMPIQANNFQELNYQFATLLHGHPLVNGFSGYNSPLQALLREPASPLYDWSRPVAIVRMLRAIGVRYVIVHDSDYNLTQRFAHEEQRTLEMLRASGQILSEELRLGAFAFELAPWIDRTDSATASPIDRGAFAVAGVGNSDRARLLVDGDLDTRWFADQDGDTAIDIEFGDSTDVARLELRLAERSLFDYPRELAIDSIDARGRTQTLYAASPYAELLTGFLRDAVYPPLVIELPTNESKRLVVRQTARVPRQWWSVHELRLWRRSGGRAAAAGGAPQSPS